MLLELKDITVRYDKVVALTRVSLGVNKGEIVTLIGSNGAGKTTTLNAISSLVADISGEIWFKDKRIDRLLPEDVTAKGIAHVPEGRRVFPDMTVVENLNMGAYLRKDKEQIKEYFKRVYHYFPILFERKKQSGASLSGGEQQMLAIGRALMAKPELLLLDEPSLGLSPKMVNEIARVITDLHHQEGISIILVEQNARLALRLAQRGYVLQKGRIVLQDDTNNLANNELVREIYLGGT
jgi:branched-chain amino acid transport system ATP-binding protein